MDRKARTILMVDDDFVDAESVKRSLRKMGGSQYDFIHCTNAEAVHRDGMWEIAIEDNGIGIDPDSIDQIFTPLTRFYAQEEYEGSGIGLATCKKIVNQHRGQIWVKSKIDEGSTFYFTLQPTTDSDVS